MRQIGDFIMDMDFGIYVVLGIIIFLVIVLIRCVKIVPQAYVYVIEKFGSFHAEWETGLHLMIPFIFRIAGKVSLKEKVVDFKPQPVITKDNVTMQIDTKVLNVLSLLLKTSQLQHSETSSVNLNLMLLSLQEMLSTQRLLLFSTRLLTAGVSR